MFKNENQPATLHLESYDIYIDHAGPTNWRARIHNKGACEPIWTGPRWSVWAHCVDHAINTIKRGKLDEGKEGRNDEGVQNIPLPMRGNDQD
jgi:hypothetical protein